MMRRPPILLALYLALVLALPPVVYARAAAFVKEATAGLADDQVLDFGSTTSASNVVVASVRMSATNTLDVLSVTETVLHTADFGDSSRQMIVCFPGGSQTYTFQSSASATVGIAAGEFSGTDACAETGTSDDTVTSGSVAGPLESDSPPTIPAGSLIFAAAWSSSAADLSCDTGSGYACIPSDASEVGTRGQAQWRIAPSTTTYAASFTWTGNENVMHQVAGVLAASGGGGATPCFRSLLGVGC